MEMRDKLLEAAARVYAESGYRGTTTRRIAEEAGVNEVTLFRHFGNKEALIKAALEAADRQGRAQALLEPVDPGTELYVYAIQSFRHFYRHRNLIRRVMGDMVENPAIAPSICDEPNDEGSQLALYFTRMKQQGLARGDFVPEVVAGLLIGAIVNHALWRDYLPNVPPPEQVMRHYVDFVLEALGASRPTSVSRAR